MMRKIYIGILLVTIGILFGCANQEEDKGKAAVEFNDKIVEYTKPVVGEINMLFGLMPAMVGNSIQGTLTEEYVYAVSLKFEKVNSSIDVSIDSISSLEEFDEDIKYKAEAINYLTVSKATVNNEIRELAVRVQQPMTRENIIRCGDIIILVSERFVNLEKSILKVRSEFSSKYSIVDVEIPNNLEEMERQINDYKEQFEELRKYQD